MLDSNFTSLSDVERQVWNNSPCLIKFLAREPEQLMRYGVLSMVSSDDDEYTAIFGDLTIAVSIEEMAELLRLAGPQPGFVQDLDALCKLRLD